MLMFTVSLGELIEYGLAAVVITLYSLLLFHAALSKGK